MSALATDGESEEEVISSIVYMMNRNLLVAKCQKKIDQL